MNATRHLRFFVQLKRCSRKFRLDQSPSWSAPDPLIPDPIHPSKLPPIIHQIVVLENASQTFILWRVWYALVHGCLKCLKIQFLNGKFFRRLYIFNFHRPYTFADRLVSIKTSILFLIRPYSFNFREPYTFEGRIVLVKKPYTFGSRTVNFQSGPHPLHLTLYHFGI